MRRGTDRLTVAKAMAEFKKENRKIEPMAACLCVLKNGSHRVLPILPDGTFLDGEHNCEAVWFCKASSATKLIGTLFESAQHS